ncbi:MAG TPA: response regulator [Steroidobacteraceae bacterium]|jgi:CheY-like chemotaxis protein
MHILLVEDSDEVSCITVEYLHELNHSVSAVPDAEQALSRLREEPFDALMTDVRLPGMSGLDLARTVSSDYPKLPVVIASGYGLLQVEYLGDKQLGNVLMLPKPYDLDALDQALKNAAALADR